MLFSPTATDQCALLDPTCYEWVQGESWSRTVPTGTVWYALNIWNVYLNGSMRPWFHRRLHVDEALPLTPGTTITAATSMVGFAYICKPELLVVPTGMTPESLLTQRQATLRLLPQFQISGDIPAGSPAGYYVGASFGSDFSSGMLNHTFNMNTCWVILVGNMGNDNTVNAMNTLDEISDSHAMRLSGPTLCPFIRASGGPGWNGIWVQQGSRSGNYSDLSTEDGFGGVIYQKLPTGW